MKKRPNGTGSIAAGYLAHQIDGVKKFEHVRIAEAALGRELPPGAVVHHANGDRSDNRKENLVICPDRAYHNFLHARMRAQAACGDVNKRKCKICKRYDSLDNLSVYTFSNGATYWHKECRRVGAKNAKPTT